MCFSTVLGYPRVVRARGPCAQRIQAQKTSDTIGQGVAFKTCWNISPSSISLCQTPYLGAQTWGEEGNLQGPWTARSRCVNAAGSLQPTEPRALPSPRPRSRSPLYKPHQPWPAHSMVPSTVNGSFLAYVLTFAYPNQVFLSFLTFFLCYQPLELRFSNRHGLCRPVLMYACMQVRGSHSVVAYYARTPRFRLSSAALRVCRLTPTRQASRTSSWSCDTPESSPDGGRCRNV